MQHSKTFNVLRHSLRKSVSIFHALIKEGCFCSDKRFWPGNVREADLSPLHALDPTTSGFSFRWDRLPGGQRSGHRVCSRTENTQTSRSEPNRTNMKLDWF